MSLVNPATAQIRDGGGDIIIFDIVDNATESGATRGGGGGGGVDIVVFDIVDNATHSQTAGGGGGVGGDIIVWDIVDSISKSQAGTGSSPGVDIVVFDIVDSAVEQSSDSQAVSGIEAMKRDILSSADGALESLQKQLGDDFTLGDVHMQLLFPDDVVVDGRIITAENYDCVYDTMLRHGNDILIGGLSVDSSSVRWLSDESISVNIQLKLENSDGNVAVCHGVTVLAWSRVDGTAPYQFGLGFKF